MRKRFTTYRHWSPRWKWSARAWAELAGWEHDVRHGEIERSIEDALSADHYPPSRDFDEAVADLIREDPEFGVQLWMDANATIHRLSSRLADFIGVEELARIYLGEDED